MRGRRADAERPGRMVPAQKNRGSRSSSSESLDAKITQYQKSDQSDQKCDESAVRNCSASITEFACGGFKLSQTGIAPSARGTVQLAVDPIIIIDTRIFFRECLSKSIQQYFSIPIRTYSTTKEMMYDDTAVLAKLILLTATNEGITEVRDKLRDVSTLAPGVPVIVLASSGKVENLREALNLGARGYITMSMGFDIAIEAVRFVLAGGIYFPAEYALANVPSTMPAVALGEFTNRELAVISAIREGKPNKLIAYHLNICESTVKVHLHSVMRKLRAKNRTEVAIKSAELLLSKEAIGLTASADPALDAIL